MRILHGYMAMMIVFCVGLIVWHTRDTGGWLIPLPVKWVMLVILVGAYAMTEAAP